MTGSRFSIAPQQSFSALSRAQYLRPLARELFVARSCRGWLAVAGCALALLASGSISPLAAHTLGGTVYGGSSKLAGATVTLFDVGLATQAGVSSTDAAGLYSFTVADGTYNLSVVATGFEDSVVNGIVVAGADVVQDIVMLKLPPPPPPPRRPADVQGERGGADVATARRWSGRRCTWRSASRRATGPGRCTRTRGGGYAITGLTQTFIRDEPRMRITVSGGANARLPTGTPP